MIRSYAQNFEDVILWRLFKDVECGRYVDLGAWDPTIDSVSRSFYDAGWRGLHVEPSPVYAERLRIERPDETVLQLAVAPHGEKVLFFNIPETGLSTGVADIAYDHGKSGFSVQALPVASKPLSEILDSFGKEPIHWMKVDVEGMEAAVLRTWQPSSVRPAVLVIEATYPLTATPTHEAFEPTLVGLGYQFAYFDGLNRFYVHETNSELLHYFGPGPNYFDDFAVMANAPSARALVQDLEEADARYKEHAAVLLAEKAILANQIIEQTELVEQLRADSAAMIGQLGSLQERNQEMDSRLAELEGGSRAAETRLAEAEAQVSSLREQVSRLNIVRETIERQRDKRQLQMSAMRKENARLVQKAAQLEAELHEHLRHIQALRASTSWKVSVPIRVVGLGVRIIYKRIKPALRKGADTSIRLARRHPELKQIAWAALSPFPWLKRRLIGYIEATQPSYLTSSNATQVSDRRGIGYLPRLADQCDLTHSDVVLQLQARQIFADIYAADQ